MQYQPTFLVVIGIAVGLFIGSEGTRLLAQRRNQTKELLRVDVEGCPGREVIATVQEFAPRDSGKHYHPGQSLTYVLEGSETWEVEGKATVTVMPDDFLYDEARKVHRTVNTASLKLLIVRILEKGKPTTVSAG